MIQFLQLQEFGLQLRIQQHASFFSLDLAIRLQVSQLGMHSSTWCTSRNKSLSRGSRVQKRVFLLRVTNKALVSFNEVFSQVMQNMSLGYSFPSEFTNVFTHSSQGWNKIVNTCGEERLAVIGDESWCVEYQIYLIFDVTTRYPNHLGKVDGTICVE